MAKNPGVLRLGFIPTRRGMNGEKAFNKGVAQACKREIEQAVRGYPVELVTLDALNDEGLLYNGLQAEAAVRILREGGVEALFAPHCNFGCEDAVAKVAAEMRLPLLVWGPAGEVIDEEGYRFRDSQCGLFATTKVLQRVGVPFSYITSCLLTDALFDRGFRNFLRAASAAKMLRRARVGQISLRPDAFWSVKVNEGELLERFGIEIVPTTLADFKRLFDAALNDASGVRREIDDIQSAFDAVHFEEDALKRVAALQLAVLRWKEDEQLDAAATTCWGPMFDTTGLAPCFALSQLTDRGFPTICECDLHGAVSSLLGLGAAMGDSKTFLADVTIRHPEHPNRELFWHCGVFPKSMRGEGPRSLEKHYNRKAPAVSHFEIKRGDVTLTRFDGARGEYSLLMGEGKVADGPETLGTYGWLEFGDWPKWEHRFIYGPYIHHCVGLYGRYAAALYEACRFIPGLTPDPVEPSQEEIERALRG